MRDIAIVYMTFSSGHNQKGPMFYMSTEDAMKFCSDKRTSGGGFGGGWHMVWIRLEHYAECFPKPSKIKRWQNDRGDFEVICDELGITIFDRDEINAYIESVYDNLDETYKKRRTNNNEKTSIYIN